MKKDPVIMARKIRLSEQEGKGIDREFWAKVGAEGRFRAAWEMLDDYRAIRGKDGSQPRLQKSIQNIQRASR